MKLRINYAVWIGSAVAVIAINTAFGPTAGLVALGVQVGCLIGVAYSIWYTA